MKKFLLITLLFCYFIFNSQSFSQSAPQGIADWGDATYWKNNAGNGNWNATNWYDATKGWDNHNPNYEGGRNLIFDNNNQTSMTNDFTGNGTNRWQINFAATATAERTISGSTENTFYDNAGTKPKIENLSATNHNIGFPIKVGYNPMELNPVNGNLSITSTINNNGNYIDVYGSNSKTLTITGDIQGTGGISLKQNSTIVYSSVAKAYTGPTILEAGILDLRVNISSNITVKSTASLIINGAVTIPGLTIESGGVVTVNSGKSLTVSGTITNSAGNSGLVIESGGSLINNTASVGATVKREIASDASWHFLSSPVSGQNICNGNFAPDASHFNSGDQDNYGKKFDFFKWSETAGSLNWINLKNTDWSLNTSDFGATPQFAAKTGYLVNYNGFTGSNTTKTFAGALYNGDQTITLSHSGNTWNLVGNPFPSAIDWSAIDKTNLSENYCYIYNPSKAGGAGYEAQDGGYIAAMQGFFVAASGNSLSIPNSARSHNNGWMKNSANEENQLSIKLGNLANYDETVVKFIANGNINKDRSDAFKLFSLDIEIPQVYTLKNDAVKVCINSLPYFAESFTVPLGMLIPANGNYSIELSGFESFPSVPGILLEDLKTQVTQNMVQNPVYSFNATTSDNDNRFVLHFSGPIGISEKPAQHSFFVFSRDNAIIIVDNTGKNQGNVQVYNMMGQLITAARMNGNSTLKLNLDVPSAYYIVKIVSAETTQSSKVFIQ